ncbi:hypothetical protein [Streptomyces capillispiralis]|uniref:Uncharacterized protein n=1 Tax=Streptomyces capillispiralis TaxID=68182 RepID=A0A561TC07_9ACTN|nr:hypothetical protein [Streptomyces capillispiralis]TWF84645.1 hypothetical protein FHX78_111580 [Streptomyces capillispiralis]
MTVHTAEPGSPSEEGLRLLASLAATEDAGPRTRHPTGRTEPGGASAQP